MFKVDRAVVAQSRVKPLTIVPNLDELKEGGASQSPGEKRAGHAFAFEGTKKALDDGIVEAVARPAHAELSQGSIEMIEVGGGGVLAALIGVMQQPGRWGAITQPMVFWVMRV